VRRPASDGRPTRQPPAHRGQTRPVRREAVAPPAAAPKPARARRGLFSFRRANRRITVENRSVLLWLSEAVAALARRLWIVVKGLAALAALAGAVYAGRLVVQHVVASPRFALAELRIGPTTHVDRAELVARAGVTLGDRLLALDTDAVAARLARHPWIVAARVRRELPATLVIDVTERHAAAVAVVGGLYLVDDAGHPFKRATLDEADGLIVLTGVSRDQYAGLRDASEAAFREALALYAAYQHPDSLAAARHGTASAASGGNGGPARAAGTSGRPALSEIHIDPRNGFSLFLYDGSGAIRLGRGDIADKLARVDEILADLGPTGLSALQVMHLDGPTSDRVPVRFAHPPEPSVATTVGDATRAAHAKKSTPARNPSISGRASSSPAAAPRREAEAD